MLSELVDVVGDTHFDICAWDFVVVDALPAFGLLSTLPYCAGVVFEKRL